jgi:integrase
MSLFKRGETWWYDFQLDGVRIRESTGLTQKSAAAQAEAMRKADLTRGFAKAGRAEPSPKFDEFAHKEFAAWSENQHREHPSTHERYMRSVKTLVHYFGQRRLDMISTADAEQFKIVRSRERRKYAKDRRAVTPAAVNRDLAVLRILFNVAIRFQKAKVNPVMGIKLLPENNLQTRVVSFEEEQAYLVAASQPLRDIAIIILETGMRPGEIFRLRKEDVNLGLGFLRIPAGKTPFARRTIPLTERCKIVLSVRTLEAKSNWLFPARHDTEHPINWLRNAHIAACQKAGINPSFRLYDLRHTALTRMAMAGVDLPTLRELAGHANIQMTMRYVHPSPEHKRAAMQKLEDFTRGVSLQAPTAETVRT